MKQILSRRSVMGLGAAALLAPRTLLAAGAGPVLVELFTSQGCSSCPPADKLAGELASDPGIIMVSLNVDYWDYLGWRDTLAKPEFTKRQYEYAHSRGDGDVYTPQMVINGASHVVGSNRADVTRQITAAKAKSPMAKVVLTLTPKAIEVKVDAADFAGDATLWLMAIAPEMTEKIERGENAGQDITYHNVVRNLVPAAMWKGEAYQGRWMRDAVMLKGCTQCVAVLQSNNVGPVLGVARA